MTNAQNPNQYADVVSDKTYTVTSFPTHEGEHIALGGYEYGQKVVHIDFYTGFAGCPARYYVTKIDANNGRKTTYIRFA